MEGHKDKVLWQHKLGQFPDKLDSRASEETSFGHHMSIPTVSNAVNFFIMCVYPASCFCKSTCQILSYLDNFAPPFYSVNSKHIPGKVQDL